MLTERGSYTIERAIESVAEQLDGWGSRRSWRTIADEELYDTLAGCILGSFVRHDTSVFAFERLARASLTRPMGCLVSLDCWEADVRAALAARGPFGTGPAHRFPNAAARHLRRTYESLGRDLRSLRRLLVEAHSGRRARSRLMSLVSGFGPKQASLFLRNIGYCCDLAVLDVHVLRYMSFRRLCDRAGAPRSLRDYESLEDRLLAFSRGRGINLERLDVAIWIVMRSTAV